MPTSSYLKIFFGCCEYVLQLILRQERKSGQPSHGICIFDMGNLNLANHMNPMSACNKVFKMRAIIWQEMYPEMIQRIIVVNPPYLIGVIWMVIRFLLDERAQKLLHFAHKKEVIFSLLDPAVTPVAFGGQFKDASGWSDRDDCCNTPLVINENDFYIDGTVWKSLKVEAPESVHLEVKSNTTRILTRFLTVGDTLAWHFWTNGEVEFAITRSNEDGSNTELVYPRLKLVTTKVAEESRLKTEKTGLYCLEFVNTSHYFALKIDVAVFGGSAR